MQAAAAGNGPIQPFPGGAFLHTGIHTGEVTVQAVTYTGAPNDLDSSRARESIAEVTVEAVHGRVRVQSHDSDPEEEVLSAAGRGTCRVRAYAIGRDTDIDGATSFVESYRLEIWPEPAADPVVYRAEDRYGQQIMASLAEDEEDVPEPSRAGASTAAPTTAGPDTPAATDASVRDPSDFTRQRRRAP